MKSRRNKTAQQRAADRDSRELRKAARQRALNAMVKADPKEIQARMLGIIAETVGERGTVSRDDFLRAGIPAAAIDANYKSALAAAREANPSLGALEVVP